MRRLLFAILWLGVAHCQQCDVSSQMDKFDCYPEHGSNEQGCKNRGCCWQAVDQRQHGSLNVPYCYYPRISSGYRITSQAQTAGGFTLNLRSSTPSHFGSDIQDLRVEVIQQSSNTVRIRIVDANQKRWEPPIPKPPAPTPSDSYSYAASVTVDGKLEVHRKNGNQNSARIVSLDLASMIYTDTFLQITSTVPSNVLYGLGEHRGALRKNMNSTRLTFYNADTPPAYNRRLYGTHPVYINIEDDGKANGVWLLNSNAMDIILQPTPSVTYRPVGGILDFFIFTGPTPADVIKQYQEMVGKPKMVPYWSLGFHLCRFGYKSTQDTRETLQRNLDAGVKVDVQWNDIDYMDKRNGFTLDPQNYADLGSFVKDLHNAGRHYVMIVDPAISGSEEKGRYPPYDLAEQMDVLVKDKKDKIARTRVWNLQTSVFPDFTHPNATAYWTKLYKDFHDQVPYDGTWIDMNEPANMLNGHVDEGCPHDSTIPYTPGSEALQTKTLCNSDKHYWSSHYDVHNLYGFSEAIVTYDAQETVRPNKRPFIISRSSFSGLGNYSGHWTGDIGSSWSDLKDSIPGFLEFSFYGVPMVGADICGFIGDTNEEICSRWQAVGAFYPFSRNHNNDASKAQDPAVMGGRVLATTKNAFYWRYKLLPFLYTLFYRAHVDGDTVARPLFLEYPLDRTTYDIDEQFMWGPALMVLPVLREHQDKIDAYFPAGIWYDLQNNNIIDTSSGGKHVSVNAERESINFFMKGGNAVFFQEPGQTTTDSRKNPFGLYVFLDNGSAKGELYIDDGESIDAIEKGNYSLVKATATKNLLEVNNVEGQVTSEKLDTVIFYGISESPSRVVVNSKETQFSFDAIRKMLTLPALNAPMGSVVVNLFY